MGKSGSNEKGGLTRHLKALREKNIDKELERGEMKQTDR